MAIVKMKRIRLIALARDRETLLADLLHVGCVEVSEPEEALHDPAYAGLLRRDVSRLSEAREQQGTLKQAIDTLNRLAHQKSGLFTPRELMAEDALLSADALAEAVDLARSINDEAKAAAACSASIGGSCAAAGSSSPASR